MVLSKKRTTTIASMDEWILEGHWNQLKTFEISKVIHSHNKKKLAQLYYEFELANQLDVPTIIQPLTIEQEELFLKMNYNSKTPYTSLADYISVPLYTYNFLKTAIKITNCFIDLHQASYIYRNLHPKHFLIDTRTLDVKIFNLEYSYKHTHFKHMPETDNTIHKHRLAYLAPEETGRVNNEIDFRTDLYSLGVLFYEMIAGRTPYDEKQSTFFNKMLTTEPPSFKDLDVNVPPIIENIIRKLLNKNKSDRYQSAIGLKEDLTRCLHLFTNDLPLHDFELGVHDHLGESQLTKIIPSRERKLNTLLQNTQILSDVPQIHLIAGQETSGKTHFLTTFYNALQLNERYVLMLSKNSAHIRTKVPIFILAIRQQLESIQHLDEKTQRLIKDQLLQSNILIPQSILRYFPEFEAYRDHFKIINDLQNVKQEHFFNILVQLIHLFHRPTSPATILVDDWEDLDYDSLQFISYLMSQQTNYLFVVTSNTTNLLDQKPFPSNCIVSEHAIQYLTESEVLEWVQQSFNSQEESLQQLAQFLFEMTKGSPLLIQEFFWQICDQKLLKFDHYEYKWLFDVSSSQSIGNIPAFRTFIEQQMDNLSDEQRLVLKYASCIGKNFQVEILLHIVPLEQETTLQIYLSLLEMHFFIAKQEDTILLNTFMSLNIAVDIAFQSRFFNEDVFDATIAMTSKEEASTIHYAMYQYLMNNQFYVAERNRLILHHLSFCQGKINEQEMQMYLRLNYEIGTETILNGMYRESLTFSQEAFKALAFLSSTVDYKLALEIYVSYANALYLNNLEQEANDIFEKALQQCQTRYDRLFVYNEKIMFHMMGRANITTQENLNELLDLADKALAPFKIPLKANISTGQVVKEYFLLKANLKSFSNEHFLQLAPIEQAEIKLILKTLMNILGVALILDEKLYTWIVMRAIRLIKKHGDTNIASVFYGNFANILMTGFNNFNESYRFAKLSIAHLEKHNDYLCKGNVYLNFGVGISSLKMPYDTSIYYLKELQKIYPDDSLHRLYNATASAYLLNFTYFQGVSLNTVKTEYLDYQHTFDLTNNVIPKGYVAELLYWIHLLQNPKEPLDWQLPVPLKARASFWESHLILRLQMSYLLSDMEQAEKLIQEIKHTQVNAVLSVNKPHYYYYYALWLFRKLHKLQNKKEKAPIWKEIKNCLKQLDLYRQHNPQSFEHYAVLIKALYYQHTKQTEKAIFHFDRAIQLAKLLNNARDAAIAKLNTALFYESQQDVSKAQLYMQSAVQSLYAWKAPRIAQLWTSQFYYLWKKNFAVTEISETLSIDIQPIESLYQIIAQESTVETLLRKSLMEMLNHLDAEQIYFFKVTENTPTLLAYANSVDHQYNYYVESTHVNLSEMILTGVHEAIASKTYLINPLPSDYTGSVLSLPLFIKGDLEAVVYCTNDLIISLFTRQKIDVVTILATQMLLAMDNIERQKALELQVATRTAELSKANEQLKDVNSRLQQNEDELKRFIQHISHDLRTPITSVLGYVEALSGDLVIPEEKKQLYLNRSKVRLLALNSLIQDLFDISLLQGGRIEFNKEEIAAKQFFALIDTVIQNDLEHANVQYISSFLGDEAIIHVDINRFIQVIGNMTNNILKYANKGTVQLTMICEEDALQIVIQDEGRGIPAKDLPFIFDLNFTASNNVKNKNSYGIGLAICKQIVDHHNGNIHVKSEENNGSTFTIILPCTPL